MVSFDVSDYWSSNSDFDTYMKYHQSFMYDVYAKKINY